MSSKRDGSRVNEPGKADLQSEKRTAPLSGPSSRWARPVVLENDLLRLEPLSVRHADDLYQFGSDERIWKYTTQPPFKSLEEVEVWIERTLQEVSEGRQVAFTIVDKGWGQAVGSTRFFEIRPHHSALEIGYTWLGKASQGTGINSMAKYLLLEHCFEKLNAVRVQFKTDVRNLPSRKALEKIGAREEGFLRRHMLLWNGHRRDTVIYSIIEDEWPRVKTRLLKLIKN